MTAPGATRRHAAVTEALRLLGIRNFLFGIHDPAFPSLPEEDTGRGTPYSLGAAQFLDFVRELGFNGVQLGPQGLTSPANPSPYDATLFSRNPLSLSLRSLTRPPWRLLGEAEAARCLGSGPASRTRVQQAFAHRVMAQAIAAVCQKLRDRDHKLPASLSRNYAEFRRTNARWLQPDALYEVLRQEYGGRTWTAWGEEGRARLDKFLLFPPAGSEQAAGRRIRQLLHRHAAVIEEYSLVQFPLHAQHRQLRKRCRQLGLRLFGDLQIGFSGRDTWRAGSFLLPGYVLGAPPSRTNPEGQPWNYPVPDPSHYFIPAQDGGLGPGAALLFLRHRVEKLLAEFDGLRIDHPHGLVCPWVYRAGQEDPQQAVKNGARLFASPDLPDHPELSRFAIVRPEQIDRRARRYDDDWVTGLDEAQVRRYATLFEVIMQAADRRNCGTHEIACEILSTQPYPIKQVMALYGLGRFRITQKADLGDPLDVYRGENATANDWVMLGNHDTASIWEMTAAWCRSGASRQQAAYLATRLAVPAESREKWIARKSADPGELAQAKLADLFVGPATNVMVFFTDLLGIRERYNRPGTVSAENWSLRVPPDYRRFYSGNCARKRALDLPGALAEALRARGPDFAKSHRQLIRVLEENSPFRTAPRADTVLDLS